MKAISLKIKDEIFEELEKEVKQVHMSRNAYINKALEVFNKLNRRRKLAKLLRRESKLVAANSMEVLREIEFIDPHLLE